MSIDSTLIIKIAIHKMEEKKNQTYIVGKGKGLRGLRISNEVILDLVQGCFP